MSDLPMNNYLSVNINDAFRGIHPFMGMRPIKEALYNSYLPLRDIYPEAMDMWLDIRNLDNNVSIIKYGIYDALHDEILISYAEC